MNNEAYDDGEVPPKKIKSEWSKSYSSKAMEMMKKMGYESDRGLGKQSQGRLEPVVAFQQDGRKGLGLKLSSAEQWDSSLEKIYLPEVVNWLENHLELRYNLDDMKLWIKYGLRQENIISEHLFCQRKILTQILETKSSFDTINDDVFKSARYRSNVFETIRSSIFQNRAAVKMANIDALLDFMFTKPVDQLGNSLVKNNELLYFADICAGPGGFSEYILYRMSWEAKGFGFTLRGSNDFKLDKFVAGSPESFDPYYGIRKDGNIYAEDNQDSFANYVHKHCPEGVHFVMADGGFSTEGVENIQEILSKQLYLCQFLMALKLLRTAGHFVCKLFDIFTPFSVGLIYLMYHCFEMISVIKPNSSRPANSERYLVCKWKKRNTDDICSYLNIINNLLNAYNDNEGDDVIEIVQHDVLFQDNEFINYIKESNNFIGSTQIIGLRKLAAFCHNSSLKESRQLEVRKRCLDLWKLPDTLRQRPENISNEQYEQQFLIEWYTQKDWMNNEPHQLLKLDDLKPIESIHDWYFVPIGRKETNKFTLNLFMCPTRGKLYRYINVSKRWELMEPFFDISPKSFFWGEQVCEYSGEARTQTSSHALHIIDAIMLGGKDIRRLPLHTRMAICTKFVRSISKPYREDKSPAVIRSKPLFQLKDLKIFFNQMRHYTLKGNQSRYGLLLDKQDGKFFVPGGIILLCAISHDYYSLISKSRNMLYYFVKSLNSSFFEDDMPFHIKKHLYSSFRNSYHRRLLWRWTNPAQVEENSERDDDNVLYRKDFQEFINKRFQ